MGANVTIADLSASTSAPRLRAGITVVSPVVGTTVSFARSSASAVQPSAQATCVVPVADVSYILLATSAYLDESGRFKFIQEITAVTDRAVLSVSKGLVDVASVADFSTREVNKGLSDSISFTETFVRTLIIMRSLADTYSVADALQIAHTKLL